MDKILTQLLISIAEEEGVSFEEVEKIFTLPYKQMRHHIMELDFSDKVSSDIVGVKTNFNMPALFKLYLNKNKLDKFNIKEKKNHE